MIYELVSNTNSSISVMIKYIEVRRKDMFPIKDKGDLRTAYDYLQMANEKS